MTDSIVFQFLTLSLLNYMNGVTLTFSRFFWTRAYINHFALGHIGHQQTFSILSCPVPSTSFHSMSCLLPSAQIPLFSSRCPWVCLSFFCLVVSSVEQWVGDDFCSFGGYVLATSIVFSLLHPQCRWCPFFFLFLCWWPCVPTVVPKFCGDTSI